MNERIIINRIERCAVRQITSFVGGYISPDDKGRVTVFRAKRWPAYYIVPKGNKYQVYVYRAKQGLSRIFKRDPEGYLEKFTDHDYISWNWPSAVIDNRDIIKQLLRECDGIIKEDFFRRETPAETTKVIPKLFGENIFISQEVVLSKQKLVDLLVGKEKMSVGDFVGLFGQIEFEESERIQSVKYGKWIILVDNKTKRSIDDVKKLLALTESHLNKKGFGNLAYGRVLLVDKLRGKNAADYEQSGDIIRLESNLAASMKELASMLHEIGHRNYYRYLGSSERLESDILYDSLKKKRGYFKKGDTLIDIQEPGEKYQLLGKKGTKYVVRCVDSDSVSNVGEIYNFKNVGMGTRFIKETDEESQTRSSFFPRTYGLKNKLEFYAVLFETWLTKGLNEPAKNWFEGLHKVA